MSDMRGQKSTGEKIADIAKDVGHAVSENASQATGLVKEKVGLGEKPMGTANVADIKPHMEVISSCGCRMGTVDHLEGGGAIKLTRKDSPDGQHHFIPTGWVARVDEHVHLNKDAGETKQGWKSDAAACGACA